VSDGNGGAASPEGVVPVNTTTGAVGRAITTGLQPQAIAISGSQQH
jgi:hypothetical protein